MENTKEYIDTFIDDMTAHIFMNDMDLTKDTDPMLFIRQSSEASAFYRALMDCVIEGNINSGEDRLFELAEDKSPELLIPGLQFYKRVNEAQDDTLERLNFKREEILTGLKDFLKIYGYGITASDHLKI